MHPQPHASYLVYILFEDNIATSNKEFFGTFMVPDPSFAIYQQYLRFMVCTKLEGFQTIKII